MCENVMVIMATLVTTTTTAAYACMHVHLTLPHMYPNFPSDGSLPDMSDHSQKSQGPPLPPLPRTQVPHAASNPPPSPAGTYHYTLSVFRAAAARAPAVLELLQCHVL